MVFMPLPTDEKILALAQDFVQQFDTLFGLHPGFRPMHAKGILLKGTFTPLPAAASLTRAPHMNRESTPVTVRLSDSTGIPVIPDNNPNATPHGCGIRFHLAERVHTDIIAHAVDAFPAKTGQEFLEFLRAVAVSDPAKLAGSPLEAFLGSHPATLAFIQTP
jgi:catalase